MSATRCKEGKKRKQIRKREKEWKDGKKSKREKGRIVKVKKEGEQKQRVKVKEYKREDDRLTFILLLILRSGVSRDSPHAVLFVSPCNGKREKNIVFILSLRFF
jgi:hypothetical protein